MLDFDYAIDSAYFMQSSLKNNQQLVIFQLCIMFLYMLKMWSSYE
jgi:hypothetical protein